MTRKDRWENMRFKTTAIWLVIGGLLGYFVFHPLVMIIGHIMLKPAFIYEHTVFDIIVSEASQSFSLKMLPWGLAFAIAGALIALFYGKLRQVQNELRRLSYIDSLTRIANRRYFRENLDREWRHGARFAKPISLIMCDIDSFKAYNDAYGHQSGDKCLQLVAGALSETLERPRDFVARYGGEEFAVVLPYTNAKGASSVAETMCNKVESLGITHHNSRVSKMVTISLGIATITPIRDLQFTALISAADQALYQAKKEECNRIKIADLTHQM